MHDLFPRSIAVKARAGLRSMTAYAKALYTGDAAIALCWFRNMIATRAMTLLALDGLKPCHLSLARRRRRFGARSMTLQTAPFEFGDWWWKGAGGLGVSAVGPLQVLSEMTPAASRASDVGGW